MTLEDTYNALVQHNMIRSWDRHSTPRPLPGQSLKIVKGRKSGVARKALHRMNTYDDDRAKGPFVPPVSYEIHWDSEVVAHYLAKWESKGYLTLKPENLRWSPFLVSRILKSEVLPDEALPSATTETMTPTTPGFMTPGLRQGEGSSRTDSPAFALFEDDNEDQDGTGVLPVLKSRRAKAASPDALASSSPDSKVTPVRRLTRRQTSGTLSTPRPPPPPSSIRRTRSAVKLRGTPHDEATMIAEDAALAAKLAMEEGRPRRQLRSRSNTEQEKRPLSPPSVSTRSTAPPRKKRRVESPSPPARHTRSQGVVTAPVTRRSENSRRSSMRSQGTSTPIRRPKPLRKPSKLVSEVVDSSPAQSRSSPPPASPSPAPSHNEEEDMAVEQSVSVHGRPEVDEADVKDDDRDTPLTGMTSGHSVGHSEDTVYATDDQHSVAHKVSPPFTVPEPHVSIPVLPMSDASVPPISTEGDVGSDADAEGELDLEDDDPDAEGEAYDIDAEGEDDLDAEGEPDLGEEGEYEEGEPIPIDEGTVS